MPDEIVIVDVLLETGWSWDEWERTPRWIQQVTADMIRARREQAARDQDNQQRQIAAAQPAGR